MDRRKQIRRAVYVTVGADVIFLFALLLVVQDHPAYLTVAAAIYLPIVLVSNFLFLRSRLRLAAAPDATQTADGGSEEFWLYVGSAVFFVGTLYGLLAILDGDLPRAVLLGLLVPLSLAAYLLKTARRIRRHGRE